MRKIQTIIICVLTGLFLACGGLSTKQKSAANEALTALKKIDASTQVGVNFQTYNQLLIDAKAKVNEVETNLPEGELKAEILEVMKAYETAGKYWNESISMKPRTIPEIDLMEEKMKSTEAQWQPAREHLAKAAKLVE